MEEKKKLKQVGKGRGRGHGMGCGMGCGKGRGGDKGKAKFSEGADYATNSSDTDTALDESMDMDFSVAGASRSLAHE